MSDLDTGVIDLCRRTPRKRKSKTRPFHHMTSMPPNRVPRRTYPRRVSQCLAERGDWAADFNQAQITCFKGSMSACDAIWLSKRVLLDTFLYNYGRTCGGRVSLGEHAAPEL